MSEYTRRQWIQKNVAMAAGAGAIAALPEASSSKPVPAKKGEIQLTEVFQYDQKDRWKLAKQIGVNRAIIGVNKALSSVSSDKYVDVLGKIKADYEAGGLTIAGVESDPVPTEKIRLGLPGRDEEIANYCAAIEAFGKVGIPMCCYNFMAAIGWYRTNTAVPERGGALTTEFNYDDAEKQGLTQWGRVSEEKMWDNMTYFLKRIIPVAEKANVKMALHPDDPPVSPLRGIGRIITSAAAYRRVMDIVPSPVNGVTFCQANFKAMGEDIEAVAKEFCEKGKVFFIHFRDIEGKGKHFRETFHDNGPTDMPKMLKIYYDSGFVGPVRPDHAPTLEGESNDSPGYAVLGKLFAFGYMKGIMDALNIEYE